MKMCASRRSFLRKNWDKVTPEKNSRYFRVFRVGVGQTAKVVVKWAKTANANKWKHGWSAVLFFFFKVFTICSLLKAVEKTEEVVDFREGDEKLSAHFVTTSIYPLHVFFESESQKQDWFEVFRRCLPNYYQHFSA